MPYFPKKIMDSVEKYVLKRRKRLRELERMKKLEEQKLGDKTASVARDKNPWEESKCSCTDKTVCDYCKSYEKHSAATKAFEKISVLFGPAFDSLKTHLKDKEQMIQDLLLKFPGKTREQAEEEVNTQLEGSFTPTPFQKKLQAAAKNRKQNPTFAQLAIYEPLQKHLRERKSVIEKLMAEHPDWDFETAKAEAIKQHGVAPQLGEKVATIDLSEGRSAIYQALGEASVSSWSEEPTGVFETEKVTKIGDELADKLNVAKTLSKTVSSVLSSMSKEKQAKILARYRQLVAEEMEPKVLKLIHENDGTRVKLPKMYADEFNKAFGNGKLEADIDRMDGLPLKTWADERGLRIEFENRITLANIKRANIEEVLAKGIKEKHPDWDSSQIEKEIDNMADKTFGKKKAFYDTLKNDRKNRLAYIMEPKEVTDAENKKKLMKSIEDQKKKPKPTVDVINEGVGPKKQQAVDILEQGDRNTPWKDFPTYNHLKK